MTPLHPAPPLTDTIRTRDGIEERLLLAMPPNPSVDDAAAAMQFAAAMYPDLMMDAFDKQPDGWLAIWVPTSQHPSRVTVAACDDD